MTTEQTKRSTGTVIAIAVILLLAVVAYAVMHAPDRRTPGEKIGDAVDKVSEGNIDGAAKTLQNRTPAQKAGDALEHAGDRIQKATE